MIKNNHTKCFITIARSGFSDSWRPLFCSGYCFLSLSIFIQSIFSDLRNRKLAMLIFMKYLKIRGKLSIFQFQRWIAIYRKYIGLILVLINDYSPTLQPNLLVSVQWTMTEIDALVYTWGRKIYNFRSTSRYILETVQDKDTVTVRMANRKSPGKHSTLPVLRTCPN